MQLFVSLLKFGRAQAQGLALGQEGPLVNDGADEVGQFVLRIFNPCDMQVADQGAGRTG